MSATNRNQHWSKWWEEGHITTFGSHMADNYGGAIREFWEKVFSQLSAGTRLLDIAAGNGAVATIAALQDSTWEVSASDLAAICPDVNTSDPQLEAARRRVHFFPEVSCEQQPFTDSSFDVITSQYGFEYSDTSATLKELARLLASGGHFHAIAHHATSQLLLAPRTTVEIIDYATRELALFESLERYFRMLAKSRPDSQRQLDKLLAKPKPRRHLAAVEQGLSSLAQRYPGSETGARIFCRVEDLIRDHSLSPSAVAAAELASSRADFSANRQRLVDMVDSGLSETAVQALQVTAEGLGFTDCQMAPFKEHDGTLIGWQISMRKA